MKVRFVLLATLLLSSTAIAQPLPSKKYEVVEIGACEDREAGGSRATRLRKNAESHARAFCSKGVFRMNFTVKTEGSGPPSCRIRGLIECYR